LYYIINADSKDPKKRQDALMLKIANDLGTDPVSPLCNYVKLLEHETSKKAQVTTTAIHDGLKEGELFNKYSSQKKRQDVKYGVFYHEEFEIMRQTVYAFLITCFTYVYEGCQSEWELGKGTTEIPGILTINPAITGLLRVISDISRTVVKKYSLSPITQSEEFNEKVLFYLDPLLRFIQTISIDQKQELKKHIGAGGPEYYAMTFRNAIYSVRKDLDIDVHAMNQYFEDESRKYNGDSAEMISKLRPVVKGFLLKLMKSEYPDDEEYVNALPDRIYKQLNKLYGEHKVKNKDDKTTSIVDMMDFQHFSKILSPYSAETVKKYTSGAKVSYAKIKEALLFIEKLSEMNFTRDSVKLAQYEQLKNYYNDLMLVLTGPDSSI
jgi:hypothetical protein